MWQKLSSREWWTVVLLPNAFSACNIDNRWYYHMVTYMLMHLRAGKDIGRKFKFALTEWRSSRAKFIFECDSCGIVTWHITNIIVLFPNTYNLAKHIPKKLSVISLLLNDNYLLISAIFNLNIHVYIDKRRRGWRLLIVFLWLITHHQLELNNYNVSWNCEYWWLLGSTTQDCTIINNNSNIIA